MDAVGELGEDVARRVVEDRVHGVEAQSVDRVVLDPHACVLDRPLARAPPAEVERTAPERLVAVSDVRPEGRNRLRAGAEMVVDDVQDHAEVLAVRGLDEAHEPVRAPVRRVRRVRVETVVAPTAVARERVDRHQLDRGDAELAQAGQVWDHAVERALIRERPDVQFVDDELVEGETAPRRRRELDHARRPPHALGLEARARIGQRLAAVE